MYIYVKFYELRFGLDQGDETIPVNQRIQDSEIEVAILSISRQCCLD